MISDFAIFVIIFEREKTELCQLILTLSGDHATSIFRNCSVQLLRKTAKNLIRYDPLAETMQSIAGA